MLGAGERAGGVGGFGAGKGAGAALSGVWGLRGEEGALLELSLGSAVSPYSVGRNGGHRAERWCDRVWGVVWPWRRAGGCLCCSVPFRELRALLSGFVIFPLGWGSSRALQPAASGAFPTGTVAESTAHPSGHVHSPLPFGG